MISQWEIILRLLCAAFLGSLIGIERERLAWAAGLRTHMLVAVGACLVMIVSATGFSDVLVKPDIILDPSRVAAQVVSGIGFIGAGCILLRGEIVRGLTTAASLWAVAAIGLAIGGGLYLAGAATTFIILAILTGLKPLEEWLQHRNKTYDLVLRARHRTVSIDVLNEALGYRARRIVRFVCAPTENGEIDEVRISMTRLPPGDLPEVVRSLKALPQVQEVGSPEEVLGSYGEWPPPYAMGARARRLFALFSQETVAERFKFSLTCEGHALVNAPMSSIVAWIGTFRPTDLFGQ